MNWLEIKKKNELNNGNRRRNVKKKMIMTFMYMIYDDI